MATVNSTALLDVIIEQRLRISDAAKLAGISADTLRRYLDGNPPVQFLTAEKLRRVFGANVVKTQKGE